MNRFEREEFQRIFEKVRRGQVRQMSMEFGWRADDEHIDRAKGIRYIHKARLYHISPVAGGAFPGTSISAGYGSIETIAVAGRGRARSRPPARARGMKEKMARSEFPDFWDALETFERQVVAGGVVTSADFAKMFVRTLEIFERRFAEAVAAAEPPLDESELQRVQEILSNSAVSRTLILGKEEPAN